jgi:arylsulfatase A-like enzyme
MKWRLLVLAATAAAILTRPSLAADRPNILYIMSDDHAAHAIGAYGSHVNQTPNIDRLAREGMVLTSVFATNSRRAGRRF